MCLFGLAFVFYYPHLPNKQIVRGVWDQVETEPFLGYENAWKMRIMIRRFTTIAFDESHLTFEKLKFSHQDLADFQHRVGDSSSCSSPRIYAPKQEGILTLHPSEKTTSEYIFYMLRRHGGYPPKI